MCALVRFLAGVGLQTSILTERLVTQCAVVFDPTVSPLVTEKVAPPRKCLQACVTDRVA